MRITLGRRSLYTEESRVWYLSWNKKDVNDLSQYICTCISGTQFTDNTSVVHNHTLGKYFDEVQMLPLIFCRWHKKYQVQMLVPRKRCRPTVPIMLWIMATMVFLFCEKIKYFPNSEKNISIIRQNLVKKTNTRSIEYKWTLICYTTSLLFSN